MRLRVLLLAVAIEGGAFAVACDAFDSGDPIPVVDAGGDATRPATARDAQGDAPSDAGATSSSSSSSSSGAAAIPCSSYKGCPADAAAYCCPNTTGGTCQASCGFLPELCDTPDGGAGGCLVAGKRCLPYTCNGLNVGLCTSGEAAFMVPSVVDCRKK